MSESQATQNSSRGNRRWRGGRGGRGRGGRGGHQGSERPNQTQNNQSSQPPRPEPVQGPSTPGVSSETPSTQAPRENDAGRSRGDRPRRGRGRGAASGQRSMVVSHRNHGRPGATPGPAASNVPAPGLNAIAAEFVPGQPVATTSAGPQIPVATLSRAPTKPIPRRMSKSTATDLPTRIREDIENGQYECVICTNEVVRTSRIWSCSTCWTVTHLHCVKKWHTNQMKQKDENQHPNQAPGWRCPGCNSSLTEDPGPYHCWCAKEIDPKPIPGIPPHSCAQSCSKTRNTCPHPCPLMCHAGPCPPCTLMGPRQTCFCGKHTVTKKCIESDYGKGWSCGEICGDLLPCGEHACSRPCHSGLCGACDVPVLSTCYCGKEQRSIPCDQRDDILDSFNYGQVSPSQTSDDVEVELNSFFEGSFNCKKVCGRKFDCGHHGCQKPCHPQDEVPAHCPFSPDVVNKCPCGKTNLDSILSEPRKSCQDPIPHCDKICNKPLGCGHPCLEKCHTGPCPSCSQYNDITCRCGRTTVHSICHQGEMERPMCFRICKAQLNCGRHECGEHCCPGEKKAADRRKQKRTANENFEAEHICLQVCGRQLKCGKHTCQQLCHRGPCGSCPEAIFDEIACTCGRTVLQPPQPCGTKAPECRFECTKAQRCGHPSVSHHCHPEDTPCPKCPFLVEKGCICGKKVLKNQPCWFDEARCGLPCGKKLKCGAHECRKPCHKPGECEDAGVSGSHCLQPCGKMRKSCDHPCTDQCHAPYPCKEDKLCELKALITCPCQNRKQEVRCLSSTMSPWSSRETALKCDDECLRLQRNRLLASALNIDPSTHTDDHIPYSDATIKLFREDPTWAQTQEREFRVFASAADEKRLRFKPMPPNKRRFLHLLAEDFGFDSESEDPEPHRHVCIFKTPRFVSAPHKTLAQCVRILKAAAGAASAAASARQTTADSQKPEAFNALLFKNPRFALTIEEVDQALAADLASASRSGPALKFTTSFLPSDEVVIKATAVTTAAAVATSLAATPQSIESTLTTLKPALTRTVLRLGLAGGVELCHADASLNITRKEGDTVKSSNGWSAVASRGSWRRGFKNDPTPTPVPAPRSFLALRRVDLKKKEKETASIEDDWLSAAEKLENEEENKGDLNKEGSCSEDGEEGGARHQEQQALGDSPSGSAIGASV